MALALVQLYDALWAGNVPDDQARAAAEEVANYGSKLTSFRLEMSELFEGADKAIGGIERDLRVVKWMTGFAIALALGVLALQWQILLRLPS